jgi:hypothetical protein
VKKIVKAFKQFKAYKIEKFKVRKGVHMLTTIRDLWLKHPKAKFVFWVDDWYSWSRYFYSLEQLEGEFFNREFEYNENQPWLERCNEIWITVREL